MSPLVTRKLTRGLASVCLAALASCAQANRDLPQRPDGPVLDAAEIIPDDLEKLLDGKLRNFLEHSGTALIVVSVKSLNDQKIDQFSLDLARSWDIGDERSLRGLLVLVAPNEREVRVEVSCGLEGIVSDEIAQSIIQNDMLPRYREGAMSEGTIAGVDALIEQVNSASLPYPVSDECQELIRKAA